MRIALGIEPASEEAKTNGCICQGKYHIDPDCPLHFPIPFIQDVENICSWMKVNRHIQPLTLIGILCLLLIEIITRF